MKTLYETTVINTGGRQGIVQSPDNVFMMDVATPLNLEVKSQQRLTRSNCSQQDTVHVLTLRWNFN